MLWPVKPLNRHYSVPSSDKEAGSMEVWSMLDSFPTGGSLRARASDL